MNFMQLIFIGIALRGGFCQFFAERQVVVIYVYIALKTRRIERIYLYSSYRHHQIGSIKVLCLVVVSSYSVGYYYIHPGKSGVLFPWLLCSLWCGQILEYIEARSSYFFVCISHYRTHSLSSLYRFALRHCLVCYVARVSTINLIFSITFCAIYGSVRFQLTYFSCDDCEDMRILLSSSKAEV